MIKIQPGKRTIRETTAPFEQADDEGNVSVTDIRVLYYSLTTADLKRIREEQAAHFKNNPNEPLWLSSTLPNQLHSLPDLLDEKGKPFKITTETLDTIEVNNLDAIRKAIDDDISPKDQPSKSPNGSSSAKKE